METNERADRIRALADPIPFGERLKQEREARQVTLDLVASDTRISRRYLDALERSDLSALPGGAFDRGYIRSYSQFLGIDPGPILEAYGAAERSAGRGTPESERRTLGEISRLVEARSVPRRLALPTPARIVLAGIAALGLFLAAVLLWPERGAVEPGPTVRNEPPATPPAPSILDAPREPQPSPPRAERLQVSGFGVGTGVEKRNLVGRTDRFPEGAEVWFWTRVVGGEKGESLVHLWTFEGRPVMRSELSIGGPHWRTYSRLRLPPGSSGSWAVEARSAGRILARQTFSVASRDEVSWRPMPTPAKMSRNAGDGRED